MEELINFIGGDNLTLASIIIVVAQRLHKLYDDVHCLRDKVNKLESNCSTNCAAEPPRDE